VYHGLAISDYGFNSKQQRRNRRRPNAKRVDNDYLERMINSLSINPNVEDGVKDVLQEVEKYTGEKGVFVERFITTYKINLHLGNCIKESYNNWMRAGDEHAFENARKKEAERANILQQRRS
jgi:ribosomal protein L21E